MSKKGLNKVADIFLRMQTLRGELLGEPIDKQDIYLSAMLAEMNAFAKDKFIKATMMKDEKKKK